MQKSIFLLSKQDAVAIGKCVLVIRGIWNYLLAAESCGP